MTRLELAPDDARFLAEQLAARIDHLQFELVHTDDRTMHRDLADDIARLEALRHRVTRVARAA